MKKKLIIKIGTSTLTAGTNRISFAVIESLARQILVLRENYEVVIVSSKRHRHRPPVRGDQRLPAKRRLKQAMAAIGQTKLMELTTPSSPSA